MLSSSPWSFTTLTSASFSNPLLFILLDITQVQVFISYHDWQNFLIWLAPENSETQSDALLPCLKPFHGSPLCYAPCSLSKPICCGTLCTWCSGSACSLPRCFSASLDSLLLVLSFDNSGKLPLLFPFPLCFRCSSFVSIQHVAWRPGQQRMAVFRFEFQLCHLIAF